MMATQKKKFLAIYLAFATSPKAKQWEALEKRQRAEQEQAGIVAWGAWVEKNRRSIIDVGTPLGKTKLIDVSGVSSTKNLITAYVIVEAESHAAAAELFLNHPHFTIFPGDSIETMECLPLPGVV